MIQTFRHKALGGFAVAALGFALAGCGGNSATDTETAPQPSTNAPVTKTPVTNAPAASAASFKSAAVTWSKVTAASAALDKIIKAGKLKEVHEAAFKVRDIVKMLPAQSQGLSAEKQQTLASQVQNVEQLAAKLDEAGDSGNMAATKDNQVGLNDALDIIKGLYPTGAL